MEILNSKDDFHWYKQRRDVERKYPHKHVGEPEKFPCKVESEFHDDPQGPYAYYHSFIYKQDVQCDSCGHVKSVWPDV